MLFGFSYLIYAAKCLAHFFISVLGTGTPHLVGLWNNILNESWNACVNISVYKDFITMSHYKIYWPHFTLMSHCIFCVYFQEEFDNTCRYMLIVVYNEWDFFHWWNIVQDALAVMQFKHYWMWLVGSNQSSSVLVVVMVVC